MLGSCSSSPVPTTPQAKSKTKKHPNKPKRQTLQKEKKLKRQKLGKGAVPVGSWGRKRGKVEKRAVDGAVGAARERVNRREKRSMREKR